MADRVARTRRWFVPSLVGLCALAAALYPWTIPWLIGDPAFAAGAAPFAILLAGQALASPWSPFAHLLLMAKRPGWHTALLAIAISTSLAGDLALIPRWGALGAAVATALSTVVAALALRTLARRVAAVAL